jgi:hypothetical protein
MQTIYRLNTDELTHDFVASLQTLFRHKSIEIVVSEVDDETDTPTLHEILGLPADEPLNESTVHLLGNEANRRHLERVMEEAQRGENIISFTVEEFENLQGGFSVMGRGQKL